MVRITKPSLVEPGINSPRPKAETVSVAGAAYVRGLREAAVFLHGSYGLRGKKFEGFLLT